MAPAGELLILVVAAHASLRARCRGILAAAGYDVALASDPDVGVVLALARRPAAIIVEAGMSVDGLPLEFPVATLSGPAHDLLAVVARALATS